MKPKLVFKRMRNERDPDGFYFVSIEHDAPNVCKPGETYRASNGLGCIRRMQNPKQGWYIEGCVVAYANIKGHTDRISLAEAKDKITRALRNKGDLT